MSRKPLAFEVPKGLYRLPSHCWRDDAIALGLGRTVMVEVAEADKRMPRGVRKVKRARKLYTYEEIDRMRERREERQRRAREANGGAHRVKDTRHAERRAKEMAALLVAEGEKPHIARARARAAYGLQKDAPDGDPQMTQEERRAWIEHEATSRRSERLPSVEGRTSGSVGGRR